jgi:hypothetical protein
MWVTRLKFGSSHHRIVEIMAVQARICSVHDRNNLMLQTSTPFLPHFEGCFQKTPLFPLGLFLDHHKPAKLGRRHADLDTHFLKSFCEAKSVQKVCINFTSRPKRPIIGVLVGS